VHHGGRFTLLVIALAAAALAILLVGLVFRRPLAIPWAVLLTGAAYLVGREGSSVVDGLAAVVGALLLLSAELASWSIEDDARIQTEPSLTLRRLGIIGLLVAGALLVDFILLGTAAVSASAGLLLAAIGVAAAVAAVTVVLRLVRA
jgi:small-conductance mechanosensitive channel